MWGEGKIGEEEVRRASEIFEQEGREERARTEYGLLWRKGETRFTCDEE